MAYRESEEIQLEFLVDKLGYSPSAAAAFMLVAGTGMSPASLDDWHDQSLKYDVAPGLLANIAHSLGAAHVGCSNEADHWRFLQDRLQLYHELLVDGVCLTPSESMHPEWR